MLVAFSFSFFRFIFCDPSRNPLLRSAAVTEQSPERSSDHRHKDITVLCLASLSLCLYVWPVLPVRLPILSACDDSVTDPEQSSASPHHDPLDRLASIPRCDPVQRSITASETATEVSMIVFPVLPFPEIHTSAGQFDGQNQNKLTTVRLAKPEPGTDQPGTDSRNITPLGGV